MYLSIVWHFHQPIYKDPLSGQYTLPWVSYHATKNYHQMAALVEETEFPCTFNWVPCLLEQLLDYARGDADDPSQAALETDPGRLTSAEMRRLQKFVPGEQDPLKLQNRSLLSLFSPLSQIRDDKAYLLDLQRRIQKNLIPFYKKLQKTGLVELTTSPYYHPLLPLVFDVTSAAGEILPSLPFRQPEDGSIQIQMGSDYFQKVFGQPARGLWPSEGGISQEVAKAILRNGFAYTLTDENILRKSLGSASCWKDLYEPYSCGGLTIFFRDRELSDLIGFQYNSWPEKDAVDDFLKRLGERKKLAGDDSICVVILDGENPWGSYRQNGVPFLREFFSRLKTHEEITPVLLERYLAHHPPQREIQLVAGTWMGNFSKWIGSPAKNKAWDVLADARRECGANKEIYVAEGSDWFWWYGDPHTEEFDYLFKAYIKKAHQSAGVKYSG